MGFRKKCSLQVNQHQHAVASDQQGQVRHHELGWVPHKAGRTGCLGQRGKSSHSNIGRLVEDMENKIRNTLNEIYFGKTKDIVNGLRSVQPLAEANSQVVLQKQLLAKLNEKNAGAGSGN